MSDRNSPANRQTISDGPDGIRALVGRMQHALGELKPGESLVGYAARRDQVVRENVEAIALQIDSADAFDVLELMRLREIPFTLTGYNESQADGLPTAIEVVALILMARGARTPGAKRAGAKEPHETIEDLHQRCGTILRIGTFFALSEATTQKYGPLTMLAAQYRSHELNVKFKQYAHIHDQFNEELFSSSTTGTIVLDAVGFTYEDFIAVRGAINDQYADNFDRSRDDFGDVVSDWAEHNLDAQSPEQIERGRAAIFDLMFYPGKRASFTSEQIVTRTGIDISRVDAILRLFSVSFDRDLDPVESVLEFLDGHSPFRRAALLADGSGNYLTLNVPLGTDCFRQVLEDALKESKAWKRYDRHRTKVSEGLTVEYLEKLLGVPTAYAGLKYFRPRKGQDASVLARSATQITNVADQTEADALFIVEDVAICVEVKGRSVSRQAKQGHVQRLATDLRTTVGEATDQALRLEALIEQNGGLWLENQTWLDLDHIREIRSIAVCLDDMGPLGTALDELVRAGVITQHRFPWVTSLHDLAVIAEVLDRPAEFLLYLRRRTESDVSTLYHAVDELDLFMLFLGGGLYVEPDPDEVFRAHPTSVEPTSATRKLYKKSAIPTRVDTHTDPLDAWMYHQEGSSLDEAAKPAFISDATVLEIVDFLQDGKKPGWFRFSSDLLNLGSDAQQRLTRGLNEIVAQTRRDHGPHSMLHCYAGVWGFPSLFLGTKPKGMTAREASDRLAMYLTAKKHQLRSDRALGVLLDEDANFIAIRYSNALVGDDDGLDELGKSIGLVPVERMGRAIPPSARRSTKKLRGQGKKKRK